MTDTVNKQRDALIAAEQALRIFHKYETKPTNLMEVYAQIDEALSTPPTTPVQGYREALIEIKRLVLESKGRIWTGVGICDVVDKALSHPDIQPSGVQLREPVQWFAVQMESRLRENEQRGGWENEKREYLLDRMQSNYHALWAGQQAYGAFYDAERTIRKAANIANFAMMIADNARRYPGINSTEDDHPKEADSK